MDSFVHLGYYYYPYNDSVAVGGIVHFSSDTNTSYSLSIFNTTIASQMVDAQGITKTIEFIINSESMGEVTFGLSGTTWTFGGYRDLIKDLSEKSQELPNLTVNSIKCFCLISKIFFICKLQI